MALPMLTLGTSSSGVSNTAQAVEEYKNIPALEGEARWRLDEVSGSSPLVGSLFYHDLQVKRRACSSPQLYIGTDLLRPS